MAVTVVYTRGYNADLVQDKNLTTEPTFLVLNVVTSLISFASKVPMVRRMLHQLLLKAVSSVRSWRVAPAGTTPVGLMVAWEPK